LKELGIHAIDKAAYEAVVKSLTDLERVLDNYDEIIARLGVRVQEKAEASAQWTAMQQPNPPLPEDQDGVDPEPPAELAVNADDAGEPSPKRRAPRKKAVAT
jgi:hypothetical protein